MHLRKCGQAVTPLIAVNPFTLSTGVFAVEIIRSRPCRILNIINTVWNYRKLPQTCWYNIPCYSNDIFINLHHVGGKQACMYKPF